MVYSEKAFALVAAGLCLSLAAVVSEAVPGADATPSLAGKPLPVNVAVLRDPHPPARAVPEGGAASRLAAGFTGQVAAVLAPAPTSPAPLDETGAARLAATSAPLPVGRLANPADEAVEAASPLAQWLEKMTHHVAVRQEERSDSPDPENAGSLAGSNFPICSVPTDVSSTEALNRSSVAFNPQRGEYFVVWHATTRASSNNIYGRFVSAAASPIGAPFAIAETTGMELAPSVAYDATANQYWVTWTDLGNGSTGNVHLRRLSPTGAPIGSDIVVNSPGPIAFAARLGWGAGRCIVVWASDPGDGNAQILMRVYDGSGNALSTVLLLSDAVGKSSDPDIAFNTTDQNFLVVWNQQFATTGWDVKSLGITADIYSFSPQTITGSAGDQRLPRIGYSAGAGRYLVVWYDGRSQQTWDIYGRLVGRDGVGVGVDLPIYAGPYTDANPVVAGSGTASQFAVAYQSDISGATQFQIFASIVAGTGGVGNAFVVRQWYNARTIPAIALRGGSSEYLVTFTDDGAGTQPDIDGQVIRGDATLAGSLIVVARGRKGQETPRLAFDATHDEYLTLWADYRSGSDYDLYARRVSATGDLLGQEIVAGSDSALYGYPAVAYDPRADEYLAVWQEVHSPQSGYEIYARRIGWAGDLRGAAFLVSRDTATPNEGAPRVVYNQTSDEYLVTWHAFTNGLWRIYSQRVSPAGQLVGSNLLVSASTADTQSPHVAWNSARNEYLLAWQDLRSVRVDVYAQRLSGTGALAGGNFAISTAAGDKDGCDVAYGAAANDYLAVWGDARSGGNDVYGQHLDGTANLVGSDFPIANSAVAETAPVVAYDALAHGYLVAYWQFNSGSDWDVWARFVPGTGAPADPSLALATATEVQNWVEVAQDTQNGQFLSVWQDFRAGRYNIYGQLINSPGSTSCTFTLSATSQSFSAAGGTGAVGVTAPSGCSWTASSSAGWITVTGGASGSGSGTVSYSVASNSGGARTGTLAIAGQLFTVSQDAPASCTYALSVSSLNLAAVGGSGSVGVTAPAGCSWTASSNVGWVHITSGSGTGSGAFYYSVDANSGAARSGTVAVGGQTLTVNQSAGGSAYAYSYWLPVASHGSGLYQSQWRSDLALLNTGSVTANVQLRFFGGSVVTTTTYVAPQVQSILVDVVAQIGTSGSGAIEVRSDQPLKVTTRTYNLVSSAADCYPNGTQGQAYPVLASADGLGAGQSAHLAGLIENASYRCNIGVVNTGPEGAAVLVELFDGAGRGLATYTVNLGAGQWAQETQPFWAKAGQAAMDRGYARVTAQTGSGVFAFASVIDNITNDPTPVTMQR